MYINIANEQMYINIANEQMYINIEALLSASSQNLGSNNKFIIGLRKPRNESILTLK